jgi:hypothetical protein
MPKRTLNAAQAEIAKRERISPSMADALLWYVHTRGELSGVTNTASALVRHGLMTLGHSRYYITKRGKEVKAALEAAHDEKTRAYFPRSQADIEKAWLVAPRCSKCGAVLALTHGDYHCQTCEPRATAPALILSGLADWSDASRTRIKSNVRSRAVLVTFRAARDFRKVNPLMRSPLSNFQKAFRVAESLRSGQTASDRLASFFSNEPKARRISSSLSFSALRQWTLPDGQPFCMSALYNGNMVFAVDAANVRALYTYTRAWLRESFRY